MIFRTALTALLLTPTSVSGFAPSSPLTLRPATTGLSVASIPNVVNGDSSSVSAPTAYDCDEEANCVVVDACDEEVCRTSLDVRIHGEWYDLSGTL